MSETRTGFRSEISNNKLIAALVAGFVATHIATIFGYWGHGIGLPDLKWPDFNGLLLLGPKATPLSQFWAGSVYHLLTGICLAIFFVYIVHPRIPLPNTRGGNVVKALIFATILGTISAVWWVPHLFNSIVGANLGWFSQNVAKVFFPGTASWKPIFGIYLWHAIWGFNLGLLYNPTSE